MFYYLSYASIIFTMAALFLCGFDETSFLIMSWKSLEHEVSETTKR